MLDLETVGNTSQSAIIAVGAVKFGDKVTEAFYTVIDLESSFKAGLKADASTIMWWMKQSEEARKQFDVVGELLAKALLDFSLWVGDSPVVWGNGATFDNVILSNAYNLCGLPRPWSYKDDMCYRTVRNMFPDVSCKREGVYHNAVYDARNQANHLIKILNRRTI